MNNLVDAVQVVRRVTLQRLMPDAGSVFSQLFSTLHIQEPCFTDLVILYRKSKQVLERPGSEKDPLPNYSKASQPVGEGCWLLKSVLMCDSTTCLSGDYIALRRTPCPNTARQVIL